MENIVLIINVVVLFLMVWLLVKKNKSEKNSQDFLDQKIRNEFQQNRTESFQNFQSLSSSILSQITQVAGLQKNQLDTFSNHLNTLTTMNEGKLDSMRRLTEEKLDQMREIVDEKLQSTLEKRLGESFKQVSERLEQVYKGLGEMKILANGIGDLQKVFTNIKTRGIWGEVQLGSILDQILTKEQYATNIATKKNSLERVEYAIKLPGKEDHAIWLPIDSKFPLEDYQRLLEAQDSVNPILVEESYKALENRIRNEAKDIRDKYICPPDTTDFGLLFLPIEGLYAEVLRRQGLCDTLQRDYRVIVVGPTTVSAFLNSLQMGFRTLNVEKRASEVWSLLGAIKTQFGKFGDLLDATHKKLDEASRKIEDAGRKSRYIENKLRRVESLSEEEAKILLDADIAICSDLSEDESILE